MSLASRLDRLEAALDHDDAPALLIVIADADGRWWVGDAEIDRRTVDPRTQVITITERPDGPQ